MMFEKAIVRKPCLEMIHGLSGADLGPPDYHRALHQHDSYIRVLKTCGLEVTVLEADNRYPDSVFVEDVALITPACAIMLNPGADSRRGEVQLIAPVFKSYFNCIESIKAPGTVEGGDIMRIGNHFYIGQSSRTDENGARQLIGILAKYHFTASIIPVRDFLHLKTAASYLENNYLLATADLVNATVFSQYKIIEVDRLENYAANSIWINDRVLMPAGFPRTKKAVEQAGYKVLVVDVSEFRKLDGGVSCLSLRF